MNSSMFRHIQKRSATTCEISQFYKHFYARMFYIMYFIAS